MGSFKYTIDEKGRRKTPQDETYHKKYAVIFLGCSYTFGYGVNDDETFPAQFAKINPGCIVLNYGKPANSPQEILILVSNPKFYADIPNLPAIFVYLYIPHHLERLVGSWELIGSWGRKLPCIELKNHSCNIKGTFQEVFPTKYLISRALHSSKLIESFAFSTYLKYSPNEEDLKNFSNVIINVYGFISKNLPKSKFIFCIYPGCTFTNSETKNLIDYLSYAKEDLKLIDFSSDDKKNQTYTSLYANRLYTCTDGRHPSPIVYKYLAEWLTEDLKKLGIID